MVAVFALILSITPLLMSSQTSEMFEIPKMYFMYGMTLILSGLYALDVIKNHRSVVLRRLHIIMALFVVVQCVAFIFSIDRHTSFFGYYGRVNGGLLSVITFSVLFFIATQIFDVVSFKKMMVVSAVVSVLVLMWGLPGRFLGGDSACMLYRGEWTTSCWTNEFRPAERMFSTIGQPNWLATYFVAHVFIGFFLLTQQSLAVTHRWFRSYRWWYIASMVSGVWLTGSRSALIALAIPAGFIALDMMRRRVDPMRFRILLVAIGLLAIMSGYWYANRALMPRNGITHSGAIRLIVWEGAVRLWARYPVIGTGPDTFAYAYFLTRPAAHNATTERDFIYNKAHNEFLNMLATTGAVGLVSYILLLAFGIKKLWHRTPNGMPFAFGVIGISICNFFGFSTSVSQLYLYVLLAYSCVALPREGSIQFTAPKKKLFTRIAVILVLVFTTFGLWNLSLMVSADKLYARAQSAYSLGEPLTSIQDCLSAIDLHFEHAYADRCALIAANTALALVDAESDELRSTRRVFVELAQKLQALAIRSSPQNPLYYKNRVRMFTALLTIDPDNAEYLRQKQNALSTFHTLAPTDQTFE